MNRQSSSAHPVFRPAGIRRWMLLAVLCWAAALPAGPVEQNLVVHYRADNADGLGTPGGAGRTEWVNLVAGMSGQVGLLASSAGAWEGGWVEDALQPVGSCFRHALRFDGEASDARNVAIQNFANLLPPGNLTLEFWLKPVGPSPGGTLYGEFGGLSDARNLLRLDALGALSFDQDPPAGDAQGTAAGFVSAGWSQVVMTWEGPRLVFYRNGCAVEALPYAEMYGGLPPASSLLGLTFRGGVPSDPLQADVAIVRIYNRALTAPEVQQNYRFEFPGAAPFVERTIFNDRDGNGLVDPAESLVLQMSQPVEVSTRTLTADGFFLPVEGDSLGSFGVDIRTNPWDRKYVEITLGPGGHLVVPGIHLQGMTQPGLPSGIDLRAGLPPDAIRSLEGVPAVDGGAPGVDDAAHDIVYSFIPQPVLVGIGGGEVGVAPSPDALYTRHRLKIPVAHLNQDGMYSLRPTVRNRGLLGAVQIDAPPYGALASRRVESDPTSLTLTLEYREEDLNTSEGQRESAMRVHQLVEDPPGVFQWVRVSGPQTVDTVANTVTAPMGGLNPAAGGGYSTFAALPGETIEPTTVFIAYSSAPGSVVRLSPGLGGDYTLHRIEISSHTLTQESDPARIALTLSSARLLQRVSSGGQSFPSSSDAVFSIRTRDANGLPIAFAAPVSLRVEFHSDTAQALHDLWDFTETPGTASKMRLVQDLLDGTLVDFGFLAVPQTVDVAAGAGCGTVEGFGITSLTGPSGESAWGAVVNPASEPARPAAGCGSWELYN